MMMNSYFSIWIAIRHFATAINKLLIVKSHHPLLHTKTGRTYPSWIRRIGRNISPPYPDCRDSSLFPRTRRAEWFCRENTPALDSNEISI
jgi:hypothetical protein